MGLRDFIKGLQIKSIDDKACLLTKAGITIEGALPEGLLEKYNNEIGRLSKLEEIWSKQYEKQVDIQERSEQVLKSTEQRMEKMRKIPLISRVLLNIGAFFGTKEGKEYYLLKKRASNAKESINKAKEKRKELWDKLTDNKHNIKEAKRNLKSVKRKIKTIYQERRKDAECLAYFKEHKTEIDEAWGEYKQELYNYIRDLRENGKEPKGLSPDDMKESMKKAVEYQSRVNANKKVSNDKPQIPDKLISKTSNESGRDLRARVKTFLPNNVFKKYYDFDLFKTILDSFSDDRDVVMLLMSIGAQFALKDYKENKSPSEQFLEQLSKEDKFLSEQLFKEDKSLSEQFFYELANRYQEIKEKKSDLSIEEQSRIIEMCYHYANKGFTRYVVPVLNNNIRNENMEGINIGKQDASIISSYVFNYKLKKQQIERDGAVQPDPQKNKNCEKTL